MSKSKELSRVVEINGQKLELDLRQAVRVDTLKVGDRVRVMVKGYSEYKLYNGVVAGFEPFKNLPTIVVAYMDIGYSNCELKFLSYNANTTDAEIVKALDDQTKEDLSKETVLKFFEKEIAKKRLEIEELENKKSYFEREFAAYWTQVVPMLEGDTEVDV